MYFILLLIYFYAISSVVDLSSLGVSDSSPWWSLFTYNLVHFSFIHLLVNSITFISYWRILKRYLNIYIVLVVSIFVPAVSAYWGCYSIPTVGASAVIYTLIGIYTVVIPLAKRELVKSLFLILFSFIFTGLFVQSINTNIHIYSFGLSVVISLLTRRFIYGKA